MKRHIINKYNETGQNQSESSWYGEVWVSDGLLKMNFRGMPLNMQFNIDARVIPQLIEVLREIQNDRTN